MKTDWLEGDTFRYCNSKDSKGRGTLVGKVPIGSKYKVECVGHDYVTSDSWVFYFDEIKPVIQVKGDLQ